MLMYEDLIILMAIIAVVVGIVIWDMKRNGE
jgi:hypothetical protein